MIDRMCVMMCVSRMAAYYVKVMNSMVAKGANYAADESARLKRVAAGSLTADKKTDNALRQNILGAFQ